MSAYDAWLSDDSHHVYVVGTHPDDWIHVNPPEVPDRSYSDAEEPYGWWLSSDLIPF